jgi:hypothetical protein
MKAFRLATSFLVLGFMLAAGPAMAGQVKTGTGYGPYQTGSGGEFTLEALSADMLLVLNNGYVDGKTMNLPNTAANTFQTFCLEYNEYIYTNMTYDVTISNSAKDGGLGGATNYADPISAGTTWLYRAFATGSLSIYDYTNPGRSTSSGGLSASAGELQNAIWMLEDEITWNTSNRFIDLMLNSGWSKDTLKANDIGAYGVGVLNMSNARYGNCQDQLVLTAVPEPSALLLIGTCLVCVAIAVRRFRVQA